MRRNNQRLFRAAGGSIGSDWEAEEVVQDAYVRAFRGLEASAARIGWTAPAILAPSVQLP
jgi:DNA-directed RNA polymerase specialized sigma24 family protein